MHAAASFARWKEEALLLPEELRRVCASFRYEQHQWNKKAHEDGLRGTLVGKGAEAHHIRMGKIFGQLAHVANQTLAKLYPNH
jgi:hypothetical protein